MKRKILDRYNGIFFIVNLVTLLTQLRSHRAGKVYYSL